MEAVLSSLGLGTRYCVVSADHEQPELYADDNERCPQSAFERFTDFGNVYDKFSSGERPSLTLAGRRPDSSAARQRQRSSEREKENTSPGQAVLTLFDRLAMRHSKTELSSFDRQFPLSRRTDSSRLPRPDGGEASRPWRTPSTRSEPSPDWTAPRDTSISTSTSTSASASSATPSAVESCAQAVLIDLSDN